MLLRFFIVSRWICFVLLQVTIAAPNAVLNRATANASAPLVVPPSQKWYATVSTSRESIFTDTCWLFREGNDGLWSTFFLSIGSPFQTVSVLVSTASNQQLAILPAGCNSSCVIENCVESRGGTFNANGSSTWCASLRPFVNTSRHTRHEMARSRD